LPALVVTLADNQRALTAELDRLGAVRWLGDAADVDEPTLVNALRRSIDRLPGNAVLESLVDGHGTRRVVDQLLLSADLHVRPARPDDEPLLLAWANDPETRANAFDSRHIEEDGHHAWLSERLADPQRYRLFILETQSKTAIGQVRFEHDQNSEWIISYSVAPDFRGQGLGRRVLSAAISVLRRTEPADPLVAEVRPHNVASQKIFERLGFTCIAVDDRALRFRLV
jgi:RimJ/RimL family protein N-acetyltransferase